MSALSDEPESLLSVTPIEIADIPNGEPARQLRTPLSPVNLFRRDPKSCHSGAQHRASVGTTEIGEFRASYFGCDQSD